MGPASFPPFRSLFCRERNCLAALWRVLADKLQLSPSLHLFSLSYVEVPLKDSLRPGAPGFQHVGRRWHGEGAIPPSPPPTTCGFPLSSSLGLCVPFFALILEQHPRRSLPLCAWQISFRNLRSAVRQMGVAIADDELGAMVYRADRDGDGLLSFDDFWRALCLSSGLGGLDDDEESG